MTLATTLFLCIVCSAPAAVLADLLPLALQSSQSQAGDSGQSQNAGTEAQTQAPPAQTPSPAATTAGQQKPATSKRARKKKKTTAAAPVECPPATSGSSAASADATSAGTSPTSNATPSTQAASNQPSSNNAPSNQTPANQAAANPAPSNRAAGNAAPSSNAPPGNCPPLKTVVHDGGTSEPAIQLVGGENADQASQQRSTTDQLLGSTEDNLKKVAGRELNPSQQEMVNQIQQFIEQSKAAVSAGDLARGHNLALKAHLLSDELVKP